MAAHRYWRVVAITIPGGTHLEVSEWRLWFAGVQVDGPATISSSSAPALNAVTTLKDGNLTTRCNWTAAVAQAAGFWIKWDFGASSAGWSDVDSVRLGGFSNLDRYPSSFALQWSDNDADWATQGVAVGLVYPGNNTLSAFIPLGSGAVPSYLQYPAHADFSLGTGDFTVEGYLYCDHHNGILVASPGATNGIFLGVRSGKLVAAYGTTSAQSGLLEASAFHPAATLFHAAWVKKDGTLTIFQNGSPVGSIAWPGVNTNATCPLFIGGASPTDINFGGTSAPWTFQGFLDDFRFTKGLARYSGSFIPPLAPHPDTAGTGTAPAPGYQWRVGNPTGARIQWTGSAIEIYDSSNQLTFTSGSRIHVSQIDGLGSLAFANAVGANQVAGLGAVAVQDNVSSAQVTGLGSLATQSSVSTAQVNGLGSLATQSSVSTAQVDGLGSLATQNTVSTAQVTGLGAFATVSQINDGNVGTYIAAGAISNAYIGNFISSANFNGVINSSGNITNFGSVGWAIGKAGNAVFNDVKLRGELNGGPFTGFAWPAAGSADGFHLGPSGLLLGNYNTILPSGKRRYLQINSNGNIYAPGFSIVDGDATFSGTLSADTVNTTNIVGAAVTTTYSAATGGSTASVTITVPAGSSSLVVVAYIGAPYFTQVGSGKDAYNVTSIPQGTLYVNGAAQTTQQGTLIWSTSSPTVGTYNVQIDRDAASGTMNIAVLLTKR